VIKIKIDLEKILLALFFAFILFVSLGSLFNHNIKHEFPFAYFASDAFQHQVRAEAIKDMGNFKYEAAYISKGIEGIEGRYPPVLYPLAVILSHALGVETYDSILITVVFFAIIGSFIMYFIIKNFSKTAALLSLPLSLIIFSHPVSTGFLWGHWPSLLSQSFLLLFFWAVMRLDLDKSFLIIAVVLSAITLTHTSEAIFAMLFLALFFGIKLLAKKLSVRDIKIVAISIALFFIISFYWLVIFQNTWAKSETYNFVVQPIWDGNPGFYIAGFGFLLIPMIAGLIFSLPKLKQLHVSLILAFTMLIAGFLNYIGFGLRSFQARFFWPIYLSVFFGFGLYALLKFIIRKWNFTYTAVIFIVFSLLFVGMVKFPIIKQTSYNVIPSIPYANVPTGPGIMNPLHWEALEWISKNTPEDSKAYFFYGDIYSQDALLRNSKRFHAQVVPDDFIDAINKREIRRVYDTEFPGDSGGGIITRPSFFSFYNKENTLDEDLFGKKDICQFDYYIFDKASRQEAFAQYNLLIANEMVTKNFIEPVFENQLIVILKNNNPGDDCIEERSF
tara:strand:+ start:57143 stop:58819 length:1677 start_codon:yes stop_codon:yes gene_type:complete